MANPSNEQSSKLNSATLDFKNRNQNGEYHLDKMAQVAGEKVSEMASTFADSTAQSIDSSREYVRKNPIKGMAVAAVAGAVVGTLFTMIMGRSKK